MSVTVKDFDINNLTFRPVIKNANYNFFKAHMRYKYETEKGYKEEEFYLTTPKLFSFGVKEWPSKVDKTRVDRTFSISLFDQQNSPTEEQQQFLDVLNMIENKARIYLNSPQVVADLKRNNNKLWEAQVQALCFYKSETPYLNPKITKDSTFKKKVNSNCVLVRATDLVGQRFNSTNVLFFESIFIGSTPLTFQTKLYETLILDLDTHKSRLNIKPEELAAYGIEDLTICDGEKEKSVDDVDSSTFDVEEENITKIIRKY